MYTAYYIMIVCTVYVNNLLTIFKEQLNIVCVKVFIYIKKKQHKNQNYLDTFNFTYKQGSPL